MFHSVSDPPISVEDYLHRIVKYGRITDAVSVAALVYVDRILIRNPHLALTSKTVHRLVLTAFMLAAKFNEDVHLVNSAFARIGGLSNAELHRLEIAFLAMSDFALVVSDEVFASTLYTIQTSTP